MNLSEVKKTLGVETINLTTVETATGEKTEWMKDWDNNKRVAVLIHKETLAKLKAKPECASLGLNTQIKQGAKGEYRAITIVMYTEAEETL